MLVVASNHHDVMPLKILPHMPHGLRGVVIIAGDDDKVNVRWTVKLGGYGGNAKLTM